MTIRIKRWDNGAVIFETDAATIGDAVKAALLISKSFYRADLRGADLRGADLRGADLRNANLQDADLRSADLRGANLQGAHLQGAHLRNANLQGADLQGANLQDADLKRILNQTTILPDGDLIGWKRLQKDVICKLQIPAKAKRIGGLVGRKCRCEFALILEGSGRAIHDGTEYKEGETIKPDSYDDNPFVECSHGIHFFITRQEAEDYQ